MEEINKLTTMDNKDKDSTLNTYKKSSKITTVQGSDKKTTNIEQKSDLDSQKYNYNYNDIDKSKMEWECIHNANQKHFDWNDNEQQSQEHNNPDNTNKVPYISELENTPEDESTECRIKVYKKIDDESNRVAYFKSGYKELNNIPLEDTFIILLDEIIDYDLTPVIIRQLILADIIAPSRLINTLWETN